MRLSTLSLSALVAQSFAAPHIEQRQVLPPTVTGSSPKATYVGSATGAVDTFNNIPFAVPPVGKNRLYAPSSITTALGTVQATGTPRTCPQMSGTTPDLSGLPGNLTSNPEVAQILDFLETPLNGEEDCLILNVQRPSGTTKGSKLPVVFWIYGGGFEAGGTSMYNANELITTSVLDKVPVMYVSVNYRLSAFGFLAGKEVKNAGVSNLGLLDQRAGLKWVADNIEAFGGDPSKVTIWGESAGSISVFDQMALYNGNNKYKGKSLFRGAIMNSGSIVPANPVDGFKGQAVYDAVVKSAGCSGKSNTLQCLRSVSFDTFLKASNSLPGIFSYNSLALSYLPRPDGKVLTESPELLAQEGKYAKVPFIIGDQEDEGTLFSLVLSNVTTTEKLVNYLHEIYFPDVPRSRVADLVATYPQNPAAGSPFGTGPLNELYPGYKRNAALLGDITFTLTRRVFLNILNNVTPQVPSWSYLSSYVNAPILGTFHGSDLLFDYGTIPSEATTAIQSYYISFFNSLNPNTHKLATLPAWPKWAANHELLHFETATNSLLPDTFRNKSNAFLANNKNLLRI